MRARKGKFSARGVLQPSYPPPGLACIWRSLPCTAGALTLLWASARPHCPSTPPAQVYVEGGYSSGKFPPCQRNVQLAAIVLRNLLEAHVLVYRCSRRGQRAVLGHSRARARSGGRQRRRRRRWRAPVAPPSVP